MVQVVLCLWSIPGPSVSRTLTERAACVDGLWFHSITDFYGFVLPIKFATAVGLIKPEPCCIFIRRLVDHKPSPLESRSPGAGRKNKSACSHPLSPAPHWWQFHERFQETDLGTGSIRRSWTRCFLCDFSIVTPPFPL